MFACGYEQDINLILCRGCRIDCLKDPSYSESIAVAFDQVEATASCVVVLTPLSWLWFLKKNCLELKHCTSIVLWR